MPYVGLPEDAVVYEGLPEGATIVDQPQPEQPKKTQTTVPQWGREHPNLYGMAGAARESLGPVLEGLGIGGGALLGTPAGPAGNLVGAGLGYAGARQFTGALDEWLGNRPKATLGQAAKQAAIDVPTGAAMEAGGQVGGKALSKGLEFAGRGIKQALGATTGAGPGMVEGGIKGGQAFTDAMRGKITPEEIVENTKTALQSIKEQRAATYQGQLAEISKDQGAIDMSSLKNKVLDWLSRYKVRFKGDGGLDFSNSKLPKEAATKVEEAFNDILRWEDTPGNNTAVGLDTLKQRLGNYYSDSSAARAVIADLESSTKKLIVEKVPKYSEMTKGYEEATRLIKDIESGLLLKKQGLSGQITADQTLRRLTSALRENFELRGDLLKVLGEKAGQDLTGQVAGYAASSLIPKGLVGKLYAGSAGAALYHTVGLLNPKFWPLLAASSPRAVGEFLNVYGQTLRATQGMAVPAGRAIGAVGTKATLESKVDDVKDVARKYSRKGSEADLSEF